MTDEDLSAEEQVRRARQMFAEHEARQRGEPLRRQISHLVKVWARNRGRYPGWVLLPWSNRVTLWAFTREWTGAIVEACAGVDPLVRLEWLDELTWRHDRCLMPIGGEHAGAVRDALDAAAPGTDADTAAGPNLADPVRHLNGEARRRWLSLACALLRHYREACEDERFDALASRLARLATLTADLADRVAHERILSALERWRPLEAGALVRAWEPASDPMWRLRRAALLGELDDPDAAREARRALDEIRSGQAARRPQDESDVSWLSREALALRLISLLNTLRFDEHLDHSARFEELSRYRCDPGPDLERLLAPIARAPSDADPVPGEAGFGDPFSPLQCAYQLRRVLEESARPYSLMNVSTARSYVANAVPWMATTDPDGAFRLLVRCFDTSASRDLIGGRWLARLSRGVLDTASAGVATYVERMASSLPGVAARERDGPGRARLPGEILHKHTRAALTLAQALSPRLADDELDRLVSACLAARQSWVGGEWQTWTALGEAAHQGLRSMDDARLAPHLLRVLEQPVRPVGIDPQILGDWEDPAVALWRPGDDGPARRGAAWDEAVARTFRFAAPHEHGAVRAHGFRRLLALQKRRVLTEEEVRALVDLAWGEGAGEVPEATASGATDSPTDGQALLVRYLPALRAFPLSLKSLLFFPQPLDRPVKRLARTALAAQNLPPLRIKGETGEQDYWHANLRQLGDPLLRILDVTARPWQSSEALIDARDWTGPELAHVLANIETWWRDEGLDLLRHLDAERAPASLPSPGERFTKVVEVLSYVVLPAAAGDAGLLVRAAELVADMARAGVPTTLAIPLLTASGLESAETAATRLRAASASLDREQSVAFLSAVLVWVSLTERGSLPPPAQDLVQEVGAVVRSRRAPDLAWALQVASILVAAPESPWRSLLLTDLRVGLQYLASETRYDASRRRMARHHADVITLRGLGADLLAVLAPYLRLDDATMLAWSDALADEPIREVRKKIREAVASALPLVGDAAAETSSEGYEGDAGVN